MGNVLNFTPVCKVGFHPKTVNRKTFRVIHHFNVYWLIYSTLPSFCIISLWKINSYPYDIKKWIRNEKCVKLLIRLKEQSVRRTNNLSNISRNKEVIINEVDIAINKKSTTF